MSELIFKAQIAPCQSGMMIGPDGLMVKIIPVELDAELVGNLFGLQEKAFIMTALDSMGDIRVNASIPDTASAIAVNKKTPHIKILIPKADSLTGLRLFALYGRVFDLKVEGIGNGKPKREKKPEKQRGPFGLYWHEMFVRKIFDRLELKDILDVPDGDVEQTKAALKNRFSTSSLTFIEPAKFEHWAESMSLHSIVSDSRLAQQEIAKKSAEAKA
jgi:hypothetical protein